MNGHAAQEGTEARGADEAPLLIEPVVAWPREAETDCDYLVTVDLRGPLPADDDTEPNWPWAEEEFTFSVALEGAGPLVCAALDEPVVVLHRFGGTYGPARFAVSTGSEPGTASLWLTISNQWGVPVRKVELRSEIQGREPDRVPKARPVREQPAITVEEEGPRTPSADRDRRGFRGVLSRLLAGGATSDQSGPEVRAEAPVPPRRTERGEQDGRVTVTVSFAGFDRAWAAWIGDRLERRGVRVSHVRWDSPAEETLVDLLRGLALAEGRILILVSERYFQLGPRTFEEWNAALREVVAPDPAKFAAVSVTNTQVPAAIAVLAPVDLTNMGADEAERRLLDRLDLPTHGLPAADDSRGPRFPAAMPAVWGGVPRRNTRFTGRESLLADARRMLQESTPGAGVLTLFGMSGVGKTQLAAEYVYRFGSEYDVVWWVDAESRGTCRRLLAELAPRLGLSTGYEYAERLRAVREALRRGEPYSRWLLILDGADEPDQISDLVPTGPGHLIITSLTPRWAEHGSRLLDVSAYTRDESTAFVRRRAPRLTWAEADQLAEALEDLPLPLDQAAGWLNDSDLSVEEYIALLENGRYQDAVQVSPDFPVAFRTAWSVLLNKLQETVPESVDLLRLCTFFAPGYIPVDLLRGMPRDDLPENLGRLLDDPLLWNKVINQLRQYSVVRLESYEVQFDETPRSGESVYVHRMVHRIVHQDMTADQMRLYGAVVRRALAEADPGRPTDTRTWREYAEIVPHLGDADAVRDKDRKVQALVLNALRYMWFAGEYAEGVQLGREALEVWRELLGEAHPRVWELTNHYTDLLRAEGRFAETESLDRASMEHLHEERGGQDLDYLRAANGLGADLWGQARYAEALELYEWLYPAYRDLLGDQDSRTLNALNNLGFTLRLLGRYEEARSVDRQTLEQRRSVLTGLHVWTLFSEVSYSIDLRLLGRYAEAQSVQSRNVHEYRIVGGPGNPDTLRAEHNLALCQLRSGDRAAAGALLTRVLEGYERKMGENNLLTLSAAVSHSCFNREHGDIDLARATSEFVLSQYERLLPEGHPFIIGARANQALVLCNVGEREHARVLMEQALADMAVVVGDSHPYTLGCAVNASVLRNMTGETESDAGLSRTTVARATEVLGRTHPLTLSARLAHAADLRGLRSRQEAAKTEQEALADLEATLGRQHVHTLSARARNRPYWDFEPQAS
ncbi:FxSxx-COOH system tetratricopeptide repeat protein [Streptomyces sp. NPDC101234]|uniref:FxSxx-COOH system tetratricopeptide repeat protein n=1 Tax=Streptomyces sp. NPDC101234 TaxID=3366138 RepID=UPI00382E820C